MRRLLLALALCAGFGGADAQQITDYQNFAPTVITCAATATLAAVNRARNAVTLSTPTGGATVYVGQTAAVTVANGFPIAAGAALTLQPYGGAIYCIVSTSTQMLNVAETF